MQIPVAHKSKTRQPARPPPMPDITYGSVRSGIEAATQAWHPLGMCFT